jgi:hypothetical protein
MGYGSLWLRRGVSYLSCEPGVRHVSMNFCVVDEMSMIFKIDRDLVAGSSTLPVD